MRLSTLRPLAALGLASVFSCSEPIATRSPSLESIRRTIRLTGSDPAGAPGLVVVCSVGGTSTFTVSAAPAVGVLLGGGSFSVADNNCVDAWTAAPDDFTTTMVTVTQTSTPFDSLTATATPLVGLAYMTVNEATRTVTWGANIDHGGGVIFYQTAPPPPPPPPTPCPAGSFTYSIAANGDLNIVFDQFPAPNDNSYGLYAVGWKNGHTFSNLTGSDHAGFELRDASGVIKLQFWVDYLSAKPGTPSNYGSLGVSGGDGKMIVGTATGITTTTSLDRNLNTLGYFSGGVQTVGTSVTNLLVNSPPTISNTSYTLTAASAAVFSDWDFRDTYFVTISAAKLASLGFDASTWKVQPDPDGLHNSPAKICPVADAGPCDISVAKYEVKDKQVKVTIKNNGSVDEFLTAVSLAWPTTNGKLLRVKLDGDVIYDNPDIAGGSVNLSLAQLVSDQNKRKIGKVSSDVLTFEFERNADPVLAKYTSVVEFGPDCIKTVLPPS